MNKNLNINSHSWICICKKCDMSFFSKQTRIVCESCETIDKREDKINTLLK